MTIFNGDETIELDLLMKLSIMALYPSGLMDRTKRHYKQSLVKLINFMPKCAIFLLLSVALTIFT